MDLFRHAEFFSAYNKTINYILKQVKYNDK